jgi:uncharacterized membrane protein YdjX (TVP38/TMEM64 family)
LPRSFLCVLAGTMFGASVEMALLAIACCNFGAALAFLLRAACFPNGCST